MAYCNDWKDFFQFWTFFEERAAFEGRQNLISGLSIDVNDNSQT
jgi:hypothetical protein